MGSIKQKNQHSDYSIFLWEWQFIRDALRGNTVIKHRGTRYLTYPANIPKNGDINHDYYEKFLKLTDFPELTSQSLNAMLGLASSGECYTQVPEVLETKTTHITDTYFSILREVLSVYRNGVLIEVDESDIGVSFLNYSTENILDWHVDNNKNIDFVVLRQSVSVFNEEKICYEEEYQYLILRLIDGVYTQDVRDKDYNLITQNQPQYKGTSLGFIPFYIVTPHEMNDSLRNSPISPIAHLCLHIYRNVAMWNKLIATKGDPTVAFFGFKPTDIENLSLGANNLILTTSSKNDADVKMLEMQSGSDFVERKINHDIALAQSYAGKLLDTGAGKESGESLLQRRLMAEIGLKSIIYNVSTQYTKILRDLGLIIGAQGLPDIKFQGFDEFSSRIQDVDDLIKASGLIVTDVVSKKTIHDRAKDLGVTTLSYDDEQQCIFDERNG